MSLSAYFSRTLLGILLVLVLAIHSWAGQRVALVIGNASYQHVPRLANTLNDAKDIGAALKRLGFAVKRLENVNYTTLRRGLREFAVAASASEMAVVFYAGHGIEVDKRNFLIPVDAHLVSDQDVEFEAVSLGLVSRAVERARGLRLVILDACRENPFAVRMQRTGATRSIGRGLARMEPSGETLVAYAAKEGTVASDGAGRNSPYTKALLANIEEQGLEVGLMFRKVRDAVLASTGGHQEPFVYGSLSSEGAYLTARPKAEPARAEAQKAAAGDLLKAELLFWESVRGSKYPADIQAYLDKYPKGTYEALARNRLKRLGDLREGTAPRVGRVPATPMRETAPTPQSTEAALDLERTERKRIQRGLTALGFYSGPVDGLLDKLTRDAIGKWQSSRGGAATGYLEAESARTLLAATERERLARVAREKVEAQRKAREAVERVRLANAAREKEEAQQRAREAAERGRLARVAREKVEAQRKAREAAERVRLAKVAREKEEEERERVLSSSDKVFRDCPECPEMVVVPAGSFIMGSSPDEKGRDDDEGPVHKVTISKPFAVGKYEVTVEEYRRFVAATGRNLGIGCFEQESEQGRYRKEILNSWESPGFSQKDRHPVVCVNWKDARAYTRWLSKKTGNRYRLLSEAEWEYAARAGASTRFSWGNEIGRNRANCQNCGSRWDGKGTAPVGSFSANAFGLHDMHGNVWEWVADCRNATYSDAPSKGHFWITGPCSERVRRGGSWDNWPVDLRSAIRGANAAIDRPDSRYRIYMIGFRVARMLEP